MLTRECHIAFQNQPRAQYLYIGLGNAVSVRVRGVIPWCSCHTRPSRTSSCRSLCLGRPDVGRGVSSAECHDRHTRSPSPALASSSLTTCRQVCIRPCLVASTPTEKEKERARTISYNRIEECENRGQRFTVASRRPHHSSQAGTNCRLCRPCQPPRRAAAHELASTSRVVYFQADRPSIPASV